MMILLKIIVCSILFVALYKAILENERMFRFNRFYLLVSLIASVIIPFIPIPQSGNTTMVLITNIATVETQYTSEIQPNTNSPISEEIVLWIIYAIGTSYFLFVFLRNLIQLFTIIRSSEKTVYKDYTLVHLDSKVVPHSFLKYIFISNTDTLEKDILIHELSHVRQYHTLDILFIELLKVFFWFNPAVYLYRTAMMLNHEFLADEAVLKSANVRNYQHLLLQNIFDRSQTSSMTHGFNYSIIKKRLIMMTKKKSPFRSTLKILLALALLCPAVYFFSENVSAQANVSSSKKEDKKVNVEIESHLPPPPTPQLWKVSKTQLETWKKDRTFRISLNGTIISNDDLQKYQTSDIGHSGVVKMRKTDPDYGKYLYEVALYTYTYHREHFKAPSNQNHSSYHEKTPNGEGISENEMLEYTEIVAKYGGENFYKFYHNVTEVESKRLEELYVKMKIEQRNSQIVGFLPMPRNSTRVKGSLSSELNELAEGTKVRYIMMYKTPSSVK